MCNRVVLSECLSVCYLCEAHELADVVGQKGDVAIGGHHSDKPLQRLQVEAVHLFLRLTVTDAAVWEREQSGRDYVLMLNAMCPTLFILLHLRLKPVCELYFACLHVHMCVIIAFSLALPKKHII